MTLINYIKCLSLYRNGITPETYYEISDNIYILIENNYHVFIVDDNKKRYGEIYTYITTIEDLKRTYFEKTTKNIELLLRKEKIKKINLNECFCCR